MDRLAYSILFIFSLLANAGFAQEWRDSLHVARQSYKKQEYSKALKYYKSAQKKAPKDVDLSDEMGQSAYKAREFEEAQKIYQQNAGSKKTATEKSRSYHNMGNSQMQKKDYQGAIDSYKEALRNSPNDKETRYNLSEAIRRLKDEQKQNQQQNQNQQNQNQNKQNQQNQKNQQNQQNQNQQQNNQNQSNNQNQNQSQQKEKGSQLPNKSVERMLDNLMKQEAETKRKMSGSRQGQASTKSGKDW